MQIQSKILDAKPSEDRLSRSSSELAATPPGAQRNYRRRFIFRRNDPHMEPGRPLENILVPTDFSPGASQAVARAVALANEFNARLTILHVIDVATTPMMGESAAGMMKGLLDKGFERMAELARSLTGQGDVRTVIEEGLPWEEIVAKSGEADLVVLGKSKSKSAWRIFSNRTADRVIEHADCPVLVVPDHGADRSIHFSRV